MNKPTRAQTRRPNTAATPSLRHDYDAEQQANWMRRHEQCAARSRLGNVDVLFLGDSITEGWLTHGRALWDRYFAPMNAANYGISGDRTQQVLWRIQNGALDGIQPKTVVLLIGTNNASMGIGTENPTPRNTPEEIVEGITSVVDAVRARLPGSRLVLFGIFPRGEVDDPVRGEIAAINRALETLRHTRGVCFAEIGDSFLAPDGSIPEAIMPDRLHLSASGYERWMERLLPMLDPR